ncbi:MAG: lipoyl(octanoyl) transferase LipB [Rickettsiaceae bacterium]|nr:lipoyl(octanoyl) transferase LipB [Rickettsiaceae bacterium]
MFIWERIDGIIDYKSMLDRMEDRLNKIIDLSAPETIFLLQHADVYTAGTGVDIDKDSEVPITHTGRGGKVTYHGPGQRVIYPLLRLSEKDVKLYISQLENWIINSLADLHIESYIVPKRVGIWVNGPKGESKIGAIGIRVKKWVAYHGIAVNISTDISKYDPIVPCGITDAYVTSLKELGVDITMEEFDEILKKNFFRP